MAIVYLLCGTVGSGKTTYGRIMEKEADAVFFSADEWMLHFYGTDMPRNIFEIVVKLVRAAV